MTNKLKSTLMGAAMTSAVLGGMFAASKPAEAITLRNGDQLEVSSRVTVEQTSTDIFDFTFNAPSITLGTAPFAALDPVVIESLSNVAVGVATPSLTPFISSIGLTDGTEVAFNLTKAVLSDAGGDLDLRLLGQFVDAGNNALTLGRGHLSINLGAAPLVGQGPTNGSISATIDVVPTPAAVLPALLGMGTAALRKKKHDGEEELVLGGADEA